MHSQHRDYILFAKSFSSLLFSFYIPILLNQSKLEIRGNYKNCEDDKNTLLLFVFAPRRGARASLLYFSRRLSFISLRFYRSYLHS